MGRIILYTAVSLDGYIADSSGSVTWLDAFFGEDYGFAEFLGSVGTLIMGRITFDQVTGFGDWPYGKKQTLVLTRDGGRIENMAIDGVRGYKGDVRAIADEVHANSGDDAWLVGGARTNAQFMHHDLIDEIHLTMMPVALGRGMPLFTPIELERPLRLLESKQLPNGAMMMRYSSRTVDRAGGQPDKRLVVESS